MSSQLNQHLPVIRELADSPCPTTTKGRYVSMAPAGVKDGLSQQMAGRTVA